MPSHCPHAQRWLRSTFYQWLQPASYRVTRQPSHFLRARQVSTTSAINRGLRAEVENDAHRSSTKGSSSARRRGESLTRNNGSPGNSSFTNVKKHTNSKLKHTSTSRNGHEGFRKIGVEPEQSAANTRPADARGSASIAKVDPGERVDPNKGLPWRNVNLVRKYGGKTEVFKYTGSDGVEGMPSSAGGLFEGHRFDSSANVHSAKSQLNDAPSSLVGQNNTSQATDRHNVEGTLLPATEEESTAASHSQDIKTEREGENYEDLQLLTRALQQAENSSNPDARDMREKTRIELCQLIDVLNGKSLTISQKRHLLRKVLGPHTTIVSESDKRSDYLWTTHRLRPRNMPRSIIWLDRETGKVELIPPERKSIRPDNHADGGPKHADAARNEKEIHKLVNQIGYQALQTVVARCSDLLTSIQAAERTGQDNEGGGMADEIAGLRECVRQLNEDFARERRVHFNVVRTAMTAQMGVPGRFWTKLEPDGRRTRLWYDETSGKTELVVKNVVGSEALVEGEQRSNVPDTAKVEPELSKKYERAQAVLHIRSLLDRCRGYLEIIQKKERTIQSAHRGRRELLAAQRKVVEMVDEVNSIVRTSEVDLSDLKFAVKEELGNSFALWSFDQPNGAKTVVWLKDYERQLVVVGKVGSLPLNEPQSASVKSAGGPAWDEVRDWIQSQAGSVKKRAPQRAANDARAKPFDDGMPISVPYTTAASTFVYGANAVLASLSAKKRKFFHLYFAGSEADIGVEDTTTGQIQKLGKEVDLPTTYETSRQLLDKMSDRRPHNGIALEASQIPAPSVVAIGKPDMHHSIIPLQLDRQSPEDIMVNGAPTALPLITKTWRHPFILMLDGILDEGNLGNIMRTAYFYGVDAVAVSKNTCASINSSIVAKASSGAIEAIQILSLPFPSKLIYNCLRASWRVYAAVPPPAVIPASETGKYLTHASVASRSPLQDHACILMLGAEGEGLRGNLKTRADYFVSIEQGERAGMAGGVLPGIGVDSMNVSSAAGVLVESFMRKAQGAQMLDPGSALGF